MESALRSTNNEKRALKNNRRVKQNFRSVCSSLESNLKTQKNCIDASKARFLKLMRGKLPSISASGNDIGKSSNTSNRLTNDSRSIKDEKGFRFQRLIGNGKNLKLISLPVETETFSSYYKKIKSKSNFYNGDLAFPLVKSKNSRCLSRSLSDLQGLSLRMNDKTISGCAERVRKISTSIPEYLGEILDENKELEETDSYNQKKLQDEFHSKLSEDKPTGKRNLSKSLGDLISTVYQNEATAFRGLMIKNRAIIKQTHRPDCDHPRSRTRR